AVGGKEHAQDSLAPVKGTADTQPPVAPAGPLAHSLDVATQVEEGGRDAFVLEELGQDVSRVSFSHSPQVKLHASGKLNCGAIHLHSLVPHIGQEGVQLLLGGYP